VAVKRYSVPLKTVPRKDNPKEVYYHPDMPEGVVYSARSYDIKGMVCKVEVEESKVISNGVEIDEGNWKTLLEVDDGISNRE